MREEVNYWQRAMARKMSRRGVLAASAGVALGLAGGSLIGCSQPQEQAKTGVTPTGKQPKYGGTYRWRGMANPPTLDPAQTNSAPPEQVFGKIYNRLVRWRYGPGMSPGSTEIMPDLAEKWEQPDPTTYIFHLYKGVKYQNLPPVNGRECTAEDVKYSLDRIKNPETKAPLASMYKYITSIDVVDKYTVRIKLDGPHASFWNYIADYYEPFVIPHELVEKNLIKQQAIGTGAFMLDSWEPNTKVVLKRNPDHFIKNRPYLDSVHIFYIPDSSTYEAAYVTGQLDMGSAGTDADLERIKKAIPDTQATKTIPWNTYAVAFSQKSELFKNLKVRQAIKNGIDYQRLVDTALRGQGYIQGFYPSIFPQYQLPEEERKRIYKQDLAKAKQLLAEAGYPNGFKTTCFTATNMQPTATNLGQQIAQDLKPLGIEIEFKSGQWAEQLQKWSTHEYEMMITSIRSGIDPTAFTYEAFHTKGGKNYTGFSDPKMDALCVKQDTQLNDTERKQTILEIQRLAEELVPEICLPVSYSYILLRGYVMGWAFHFDWMYANPNMMEYWLDK